MVDILDGVVASLLILRASIGGSQIKTIVGLAVFLQTEGDTDKSTGTTRSSRARFTRQIDFNGAVFEPEACHDREMVYALAIGSRRGG